MATLEKRLDRMERYLDRKIDGPRPLALTDFRWTGPCPGPSFRGYRAGADLIEAIPGEPLERSREIATAIVEGAWRPSFDAVDLPRIQFHKPHSNAGGNSDDNDMD